MAGDRLSRGGGVCIAELLGGRKLQYASAAGEERLLNAADELAVAAGLQGHLDVIWLKFISGPAGQGAVTSLQVGRKLEQALERLAGTPEPDREPLLKACVAVETHDKPIGAREHELLRALASALDTAFPIMYICK